MSQERDQERICLWATDAASSMSGSSLAAVALNDSDRDDHCAVFGKLGDSPLPDSVASALSMIAEIEWPPPSAPGEAATLEKTQLPGALTREGINHMVRMPVRTIHQEFGVLLLGMGEQPEPGHQRQFILSTLANQAAIALENVRLRHEADEQAQTLRGLIQASPLAIIARDRQARVQMWNPAAQRIFGWSEEEVLDRPYPLVPEEKEDEFRANIARALQGEPLLGLETRRQKKDGTQIDVSIWTAPFGDGGAMVVIADVSERKQAEEALRESEERYHRIFDDSNDAIFIIDPARDRIVDANPKASTMLGYSRRELISLPMSAVHPDEMPLLQTFAETVFKHGHGWTSELTCTTREGRILPSEISASTIEVDGTQCIVALVRDVSERRKAEEIQRELAVIAERNRIAREIHDSIAQGLTGIIWQLNVFERAIPGGDSSALESLERVRSLAKDSLRDARRSVWDLHAGFPQGKSLGAVLREEIDKAAGDGRISASVEVLGSERVLPSGVETALLRICQESLANMLKYANASEVLATLEYTDTDVRLALKDNGVGFDPDLPVRVDGDKGGFGLIGMRERARLLGGELRVESSPGKGTLVEATLPLGLT